MMQQLFSTLQGKAVIIMSIFSYGHMIVTHAWSFTREDLCKVFEKTTCRHYSFFLLQ